MRGRHLVGQTTSQPRPAALCPSGRAINSPVVPAGGTTHHAQAAASHWLAGSGGQALLLRLRRSAGDIMFCPSTKREQSVPGQARLLLLISGLAAAVVASSAAPAPPPPKCNGGFCSSLAHYPCAGTTHYAEFNVPELPLAVGPTFFVYYNIDWQAAGPKGSAARMNQFVPQLMLGHPLDGSSV
jgi:hypothetical protein